MKRATRQIEALQTQISISIHALVKRATSTHSPLSFCLPHFNPRPREEGDLSLNISLVCSSDFNPRPREEGDVFSGRCVAVIEISIHALVKRATTAVAVYIAESSISIHALVKRATLINLVFCRTRTISIHALVKRATMITDRPLLCLTISIHALVKRAT